MDFINVPKIQKFKLGVRKPWGSDIKWSNIWGDQATHFVGCIENLNASNSSYNCKIAITTFDAGPTICVSSVKEGKTQVRWVAIIR